MTSIRDNVIIVGYKSPKIRSNRGKESTYFFKISFAPIRNEIIIGGKA